MGFVRIGEWLECVCRRGECPDIWCRVEHAKTGCVATAGEQHGPGCDVVGTDLWCVSREALNRRHI